MTRKMALAALLMSVALVLLAGTILMKNDFLHFYPPVAGANESSAKEPDASAVQNGVDILLVVNKPHPLEDGFVPEGLREANVEATDGPVMLVDEAAGALEELFAAAAADGVHLACSAGYRSQELQESLYQGYVEAADAAYADEMCARPRHSEHQTGLAVDLAWANGESQEDAPEGIWLSAHAWEHGYVLRYPRGKEEVTGFPFTPGHFRYVGKEMAQALQDSGLVLEEYLGIDGGPYIIEEQDV